MTPRYQWRNPVMFVVYIGSILTTILWLQALVGTGRGAGRIHPRGHAVAVGHAAVRQLRRGDRRRPQQGAGGLAQERAQGHGREEARAGRARRGNRRRVPSSQLRNGDIVYVEQGDLIPGDGEVIEGVASINESAITGEIGAGDPRRGQRLQLGDRRHARALRLDHRAHQRQSGRSVPRPDDRHGRRREAAEDAERDRAHDPARRDDARVPARDRDAAAVSRSTASRSRRPARRCRSPCWSRCSSA